MKDYHGGVYPFNDIRRLVFGLGDLPINLSPFCGPKLDYQYKKGSQIEPEYILKGHLGFMETVNQSKVEKCQNQLFTMLSLSVAKH